MHRFISITRAGIRYASQLRLALPLYGCVLLLSLLQIWPLFGNQAVNNPIIGFLADHTVDGLVELIATNSQAAAPAVALWSGATLLLACLFGALYSLLSGGMISAWAGNRPFWNGCRHFFWSFVGLGAVLWLLVLIALAVGSGIGLAFGAMAGAISAMVLIQLVNLLGEYARAAAIIRQRRNPFVIVGHALRLIASHLPGTLSLALVGLALHGSVALIYASFASQQLGFPLALALEQGVVLAWMWVKVVRLGWALSFTQATQDPRA